MSSEGSGIRERRESAIPIYPSAIVGWRVWWLDCFGELPALVSVSKSQTRWSADPAKAVCLPGSASEPLPAPHPAPHPDCECGWHAYHDVCRAIHHGEMLFGAHGPSVVGAIAGAGRVEIHRDGFRCERAQILGLVRSPAHSHKDQPGVRELQTTQQRAAELYGARFWNSPEEGIRELRLRGLSSGA